MQSIRVNDLIAAPSDALTSLLPSLPGIYIWSRNLGSQGPNTQELIEILQSPTRTSSGTVEPYFRVTIQDSVPGLTQKKLLTLADLEADASFKSWLWPLVQSAQRPLYVGLSLNICRRVENHLRPNSRLRQYLEEANIDPCACLLSYEVLEAVQHDETDEDAEFDQADAEDLTEVDVKNAKMARLQVAESLLIRFSQPMLNRKME